MTFRRGERLIQIGLVGVGYWGPNYARILSEIDDVELTWCCDINEEALAKFKRRYPSVQVSTDTADLLSDDHLDGVIIVTPAQRHFDLARAFMLAGKDLLVEKPLTNDLAQAAELVETAGDCGKILMVDHTFMYNPAIRSLRASLMSGEVGEIRYLYGVYNALGPIRRDVSAMWDLPHFIYVANYLLDSSPLAVTALGRDYLQKGMEDVVFLTFEYPNDILFNLHCSWIDPVKMRRLVVVGTKRMVVFDDTQPEEKLKFYDRGAEVSQDPNFANLQIMIRSGDAYVPKIDTVEPLQQVALEFIESIRTRQKPSSDGAVGAALVECLTAAQLSLREDGRKVWMKQFRDQGYSRA